MTWWRRRQLMLIFLGIVSIALVIFAVWVLVKPAPNCFDGKKNQNELGVDCGGGCTKVCSFEAKALLPLWVRVFKINNNTYSAVAYVENINSNLGINKINYTITVVGQNGETLGKKSGDTFVNNRERFAIFAGNFNFGPGQIPTRAFISFSQENWQYTKNIVPGLTIRSNKFTNTPTPELEAEVINNSVYDLVDVPVTVVLSNSAGQAISTSFTTVDKLTRGARESIFFTWPISFNEEPALFDFYPHVNGFEVK